MAEMTSSCGPLLLLAVSGGTDFPVWGVDFPLWLLATGPGWAVQLEAIVGASSRVLRGLAPERDWAPAVFQRQRVYSRSPSWLPTSFIFLAVLWGQGGTWLFSCMGKKKKGVRVPWFNYSFPVTEPESCRSGASERRRKKEDKLAGYERALWAPLVDPFPAFCIAALAALDSGAWLATQLAQQVSLLCGCACIPRDSTYFHPGSTRGWSLRCPWHPGARAAGVWQRLALGNTNRWSWSQPCPQMAWLIQ